MTTKEKNEILNILIDYYEDHMFETIYQCMIDRDIKFTDSSVLEVQIQLVQTMLNTLKY